MSDNSNSIKPKLRRARAVPTLLTVPDLRTSPMETKPSEEPTHPSIEQHVATEHAADAFELTTDGHTPTPSEVGQPSELTDTTPSLDELVAAAAEPAPTAEKPQGFSLKGFSLKGVSAKAKSIWEHRRFAGKFRLEMSTIVTIAATVVACALVAKAMKPTPTNDFFAAPVAANASEAEQPATTPDGSRIDVAQAPLPVQQPVGSQQPFANQQYGNRPVTDQPVSGQTPPLAQQPEGQRAWPPTAPLQPNSQLLQDFANEQIASQQVAHAPAALGPNPTQSGYPSHQPTMSSQTGGPQFTGPQSNTPQMNVPHAGGHGVQLEWPGGQPQTTPAQLEAWRQQQQQPNPQPLDPVRSGTLQPGAIAQPAMRGTGQSASGYPATSSEFKPFESIVSDIHHNQADARIQVADQRNASPAATTMNRFEQNNRPNNDPSVFSGGVNR